MQEFKYHTTPMLIRQLAELDILILEKCGTPRRHKQRRLLVREIQRRYVGSELANLQRQLVE